MGSSNWNIVLASLFSSAILGLYVLTLEHLDSYRTPPIAVARRFEVNMIFTVSQFDFKARKTVGVS